MNERSSQSDSMGSVESREFQSIVKVFFRFISLIYHLVFVIVSQSFSIVWRSLSRYKGLQSELESANKEGECVRQRLRFQDDQLEKVKEREDLSADAEKEKYRER